MADRLDISQRKKDHIALCAGDNVGFRSKGTLLDQVELIHNAMPELHLDEVDTSATCRNILRQSAGWYGYIAAGQDALPTDVVKLFGGVS